MSASVKKWFAVLLAVWLPLFSGGALATSVTMQLPQHDACHEMSIDEAVPHHAQAPADEHRPACHACGVCHLACTGYLTTLNLVGLTRQTTPAPATPYRVNFRSTSFAPLLPPPLVHA